jgi:hypothetical protein
MPGKDGDFALIITMNLSTLAIVLVLTREISPLKFGQHLGKISSDAAQHWH